MFNPLHFAVAAVLLLSCRIGEAGVYRVKPDGSDGNNGSSWPLAKRTVGNALAASVAGDQVWVGKGTYVERVVVPPGVALYGGFAGDEVALNQRNWTVNRSILNLFVTNGPVVTITNAGPDTRVDGMTITGGTAAFGGGVSLTTAGAVIANNVIKLNSAGSDGGGICVWGYKVVSVISNIAFHPIITNNIIVDNNGVVTDAEGGGIAIIGSSPVVAGNLIARNSSDEHGGGIVCYCAPSSTVSRPLFANNFIVGNIAARAEGAPGMGGGIYASDSDYNGQPIVGAICAPVIINNVIAANGALYGAGIALCDPITSLEAATVQNNTIVGNNGEGLYWSATSPTNRNNLVAFNLVGMRQNDVGAVLAYNNVFGNVLQGENRDYMGLPNATGSNGNISAEPQMANYRIGHFHLQPGSPCVDAGLTVAVVPGWPDLDGQNRTQGSAVDIGADESSGVTWNVPTPILRVSPNGNDSQDGLSWASAKRTVQSAIDTVAASLVSGGEIWVAQGTYIEHITLPAFVYLYGGFVGNETDRSTRNPSAQPTILDGGGVPPVVLSQNGGYLISALDGFTIKNGGIYTGGSLNPPPMPAEHHNGFGGGVRCLVSSPIIANNLICSNSLGSPVVGESRGAGIYCYLGHAQIIGNTITENEILSLSGSSGGGIACRHSIPVIEGNLLTGNHAVDGAAIHAENHVQPRIVHNTIRRNSMYTGTYAGSTCGAITLKSCDYIVLDGNTIQENLGLQGAGIFIYAAFRGGLVQNNLVLSNRCYSSSLGLGGGLYCTVGDPMTGYFCIANNTFVGNQVFGFANYGGAVLISNLKPDATALMLANNIIVSNSSGICRYQGAAGSQTLRNNCVFANTYYNYGAWSGSPPTGPTDIQLDPQFVNVATGNYHISSTSPCIDAGTPTNAPATDYEGVGRALDGNNDGVAGFDIGALEFIHSLADTDRDGMSDQAETIAGTKPTDAASVLKLRNRLLDADGGVVLSWESVVGRTYGLQFKPNLAAGWQTLTNNIPGCGEPMQFIDALLTPSNRFYRLEVSRDGN